MATLKPMTLPCGVSTYCLGAFPIKIQKSTENDPKTI